MYTSKIENALARKKVFLVLDGIDMLEQLDVLLGNKDFHPGSKIIITTTDASLTESCALFKTVFKPKNLKIVLEGLSEKASLELLCLHAFTCKGPKEGYKDVSKKLANYCEGHPLALEVLGKSLHNRDVDEWEDFIERLKKETDSRIQKVLQMSFDSLPSKNEKALFKHIVYFFVGMDRDIAETILKACDLNTRFGIPNLIDRCLLRIGYNNEFRMHQLLQEMGRDVVRQESPEKPWKRSRIWCHKESFKVLKQKKGMKNVLGFSLDMRMLEKEQLHLPFELMTRALSKMENLMLLQLNYVKINGSYEDFPKELRWLCMRGFPSNSLPSDIPMENLVALDMSYSNLESFDMFYSNPQELESRQKKFMGSCSKGKRLLGSLKILDLGSCEQLRSVGGFFELPVVEKLLLKNCIRLVRVCESIEQCGELVLIDLSYCSKLEKLPTNLGKLKKVKTIFLNLPVEMRDMVLQQMPVANSIGVSSQICSSTNVEVIPRDFNYFAISLPSSLVFLSLAHNNLTNESFPMDLSYLSMLKCLSLVGNHIVSLPNGVKSLPKLEKLDMSYCELLVSVENPPCTLRHLKIFSDPDHDNFLHWVQKIVFDPDMSPLQILVDFDLMLPSSIEIEGMLKIQPMAVVEENVLRSLGWSKNDVDTCQFIRDCQFFKESDDYQIQLYYEFGIFSTFYPGTEIPDWINCKNKGASISFTIPSSPNQLRGMHICCVQKPRFPNVSLEYLSDQWFDLPLIKISNITKKRTWIYHHCIRPVCAKEECRIYLSHWMFGQTDMGAGDHVIIDVTEVDDMQLITQCGVSLMYDDGNIEEDEEDALGNKSWNHIIGRDLSPYQATTREYILQNKRFCWNYTAIDHFIVPSFLISQFEDTKVIKLFMSVICTLSQNNN